MSADDLATRARRHAATHPESRDLIEELLGRCDGLLAELARVMHEAPK